MKKILLILLILLALLIVLTSCTALQCGRYTAEFSYDPHQYMLFIRKQIQGVQNQINTAMSHAVLVDRGDFSANQAAISARNSLEMIRESRGSINVKRPPAKYAATRENVLFTIISIEGSMEDFIKELEVPALDSGRLIEIRNTLHGQSIALTQQNSACKQNEAAD